MTPHAQAYWTAYQAQQKEAGWLQDTGDFLVNQFVIPAAGMTMDTVDAVKALGRGHWGEAGRYAADAVGNTIRTGLNVSLPLAGSGLLAKVLGYGIKPWAPRAATALAAHGSKPVMSGLTHSMGKLHWAPRLLAEGVTAQGKGVYRPLVSSMVLEQAAHALGHQGGN